MYFYAAGCLCNRRVIGRIRVYACVCLRTSSLQMERRRSPDQVLHRPDIPGAQTGPRGVLELRNPLDPATESLIPATHDIKAPVPTPGPHEQLPSKVGLRVEQQMIATIRRLRTSSRAESPTVESHNDHQVKTV
jgi:hypothetical protein